jgi:hypothetical protein
VEDYESGETHRGVEVIWDDHIQVTQVMSAVYENMRSVDEIFAVDRDLRDRYIFPKRELLLDRFVDMWRDCC